MTTEIRGVELNRVYNMDCLELMRSMPDKSVDLIVTDPPYGIGADKGSAGSFGSSTHLVRKYEGDWDSKTPDKDVFDEMFRVAKEVIIFGGNFFTDKLPVNGHWIVWDKKGEIKFDNPFGDAELAYTSIKRKSVKKYTVIQQGFVSSEKVRFHPTQKPVELMQRILTDYSQEGDTILDCFAGGGSTLIACKLLKRNFIGIEISKDYCDIIEKRLAGMNTMLF